MSLTKLKAVRCASNLSWEIRVQGNGGNYIVRYSKDWHKNPSSMFDYSCTCKAYKFGKGAYCKHIKAAMKLRCGWDSRFDFEPEVKLQGDWFCPRCGEDAEEYIFTE